MSSCPPPSHAQGYNELLHITPAHVELCRQLRDQPSPRVLNDLITDPAMTDLFLTGEFANRFGICIQHRHYALEEGERMVMRQDSENESISITQPSTDCSEDIHADRWMLDGADFEYVISQNGVSIPRPPESFFKEFRRICGLFKVNILGICYVGTTVNVPEEKVYLEENYGDPKDRRQRTTLVYREDIQGESQPSAWVPVNIPSNETTKLTALKCVHNCTTHLAPPPTPAEETESTSEIDKALPAVVRERNPNQI